MFEYNRACVLSIELQRSDRLAAAPLASAQALFRDKPAFWDLPMIFKPKVRTKKNVPRNSDKISLKVWVKWSEEFSRPACTRAANAPPDSHQMLSDVTPDVFNNLGFGHRRRLWRSPRRGRSRTPLEGAAAGTAYPGPRRGCELG